MHRLNRYEIVRILGSKQIKISASSVYNILKRNGLNRLKNMNNTKKKVNNNKIIMLRSGCRGQIIKYIFFIDMQEIMNIMIFLI